MQKEKLKYVLVVIGLVWFIIYLLMEYGALVQNFNACVVEHDYWRDMYYKSQEDYFNLYENYEQLKKSYIKAKNEYEKMKHLYVELYNNHTAVKLAYKKLEKNYTELQKSYKALKEAKPIVIPTYSDLIKFIAEDDTDKLDYVDDEFVCTDFADRFVKNFMEKGYFSCLAELEFNDSAHMIVAVKTSDGKIYFVEPQSDKIFTEDQVRVGVNYCSLANLFCIGNWTITDIHYCFDNWTPPVSSYIDWGELYGN